MNRTDRLFALREELRSAGKGGVTADRLAEIFEVSARTIKRDISALQQAGLPVWARPGPGGGYVVDVTAAMPPVNFTMSEVVGLAAAVAAASGQPFEQDLRAVLTKVRSSMDAQTRERADRLADRVWIDRESEPSSSRNLRRVEEALAQQRVLSLRFRDRNGRETKRRVDPIVLAYAKGHWHLIAHCRSADAVRWFRLDRIVAANLTKERAADIAVASVGQAPSTARSIAVSR